VQSRKYNYQLSNLFDIVYQSMSL